MLLPSTNASVRTTNKFRPSAAATVYIPWARPSTFEFGSGLAVIGLSVTKMVPNWVKFHGLPATPATGMNVGFGPLAKSCKYRIRLVCFNLLFPAVAAEMAAVVRISAKESFDVKYVAILGRRENWAKGLGMAFFIFLSFFLRLWVSFYFGENWVYLQLGLAFLLYHVCVKVWIKFVIFYQSLQERFMHDYLEKYGMYLLILLFKIKFGYWKKTIT